MARINELQTPKLVVGLDVIPNVPHVGQAYINGPLVVGNPILPTAALAINLPVVPIGAYSGQQNSIGLNIISPTTGFIVTAPASIINGTLTTNGIEIVNGTKTTNGLDSKNGLSVSNDVDITNGKKIENSGLITNQGIVCNGDILLNGKSVEAEIALAKASPPKGFDMHHPTKKGWRLTHVCLEGPEAAVYHRGKLKDGNIIELPEYWRGLVDEETITVQLTPVGSYQELYVEDIQWGGQRIVVKNNLGGSVNCHYIVHGERKDVDKIIVEYEGKIENYPGRDQRSIVGYHYDYRPGVNAEDTRDTVTEDLDTDPET